MVQDSINAVASADTALATAQQGVVAAQAAVVSAQAQVSTAQAADSAADQQLSADLQANGPVFVANTDGTVTGYFYATSSPGYTTQVLKPASSTPNAGTPSTPSTPPATS